MPSAWKHFILLELSADPLYLKSAQPEGPKITMHLSHGPCIESYINVSNVPLSTASQYPESVSIHLQISQSPSSHLCDKNTKIILLTKTPILFSHEIPRIRRLLGRHRLSSASRRTSCGRSSQPCQSYHSRQAYSCQGESTAVFFVFTSFFLFSLAQKLSPNLYTNDTAT